MQRVLVILFCLAVCPPAIAGEATVAVAANFTAVLNALAVSFKTDSGHDLRIVPGATGQLAAQAAQGAPFDLLLAADAVRPRQLEARGLIVAGSRFTYAIGRLALWRPDGSGAFDGRAVLRAGGFRHLAMANPKLAPYGEAARQTLVALGLERALAPRLVYGQNVAQAHALAASANAELAFVALVQLQQAGMPGGYWRVPSALHQPIRQDAVLLRRARNNAAALAFMAYLHSPSAKALIAASGYGVEPPQ